MSAPSRRAMLAQAGSMLALASAPGLAATGPEFPFPGCNGARPLAKDFPQKGSMVLQRSRPPLLETPFTDFDSGVFTPNEKFFVRWHWAPPSEVDPKSFRLKVRGQVERELSLSLAELSQFERVEIAAVNQCSGNSRGFFEPRVAGAQWGNGGMGNARWTGVRLRDVLDKGAVGRLRAVYLDVLRDLGVVDPDRDDAAVYNGAPLDNFPIRNDGTPATDPLLAAGIHVVSELVFILNSARLLPTPEKTDTATPELKPEPAKV